MCDYVWLCVTVGVVVYDGVCGYVWLCVVVCMTM